MWPWLLLLESAERAMLARHALEGYQADVPKYRYNEGICSRCRNDGIGYNSKGEMLCNFHMFEKRTCEENSQVDVSDKIGNVNQ
jgi:hypothetical protein